MRHDVTRLDRTRRNETKRKGATRLEEKEEGEKGKGERKIRISNGFFFNWREPIFLMAMRAD